MWYKSNIGNNFAWNEQLKIQIVFDSRKYVSSNFDNSIFWLYLGYLLWNGGLRDEIRESGGKIPRADFNIDAGFDDPVGFRVYQNKS